MMRIKRLIHTGLQWWISLFVWRFNSGEMGNVMGIRSFTLQTLAFLRGGRRASSFLRGLATPPFPLESNAFRFNALCDF